MAKARKTRKSYTPAQRKQILAAANKQGLTAIQVKKKFGVTPVTYYSWRKKSGAVRSGGRRGRPASIALDGTLSTQVRSEVRERVRKILPDIVRGEVNSYLNTLFARSGQRRRRA